MMKQLSSPPKSLLLHMYGESIALAQATTLTSKPCPKNCKSDLDVETLFALGAFR